MPFESATRGFGRTFWARALGAAVLVTIAAGSTAAMAAPADPSLVEGSQRLLIASVLVFAAIGFVGYRIAGDYVESLTRHDVEVPPAANDDAPKARATEPVRTIVAPVTPVVSSVVSPVRGRLAPERFAQPIRVAPKMPEPQPVRGVVATVTPRSGVSSPVVARSGRTSPVTGRSGGVVSPVQARQPERVTARTVAPARSEAPRSEAVRAAAPQARGGVTRVASPVRGRESAVRARA
ncbi:hypothetical protein GJ689_06730 [Rhodoplanes serenus]|uniref:Uncharacterized protein n=1 Tax=Rhodoplanes serenus TaxID=200615 RepID=A0A9X4XIX7_9BRAD|nr:hypothetical protein [Rhodoplanes serenus]MTW15900.1 hypothetical protein [Rhodoplanes serenus]